MRKKIHKFDEKSPFPDDDYDDDHHHDYDEGDDDDVIMMMMMKKVMMMMIAFFMMMTSSSSRTSWPYLMKKNSHKREKNSLPGLSLETMYSRLMRKKFHFWWKKFQSQSGLLIKM